MAAIEMVLNPLAVAETKMVGVKTLTLLFIVDYLSITVEDEVPFEPVAEREDDVPFMPVAKQEFIPTRLAPVQSHQACDSLH